MIKNIIFDFGDIFINLDKKAVFKKMSLFGFTTPTKELEILGQQYETGLVSTQEFINRINQIYPQATPNKIIEAWNSIILDFPEYRLDFISTLASEGTYRLFLLSNTNELHIEQVIKNMGTGRYEKFKNCFERFYLSHLINMRKPDAAIYQFVLEKNGLKANETFFVDDTQENTDSASQLGIRCWNLQVGKEDIIALKDKL
ncbi:HAD family hydrolase [Maribacter thermophilus]|uniref:HAD family hydrolase n=1 Tax=Maribacter thermophilus TaxID=1197874 RepID=UPI000641178F|nr:HAD family phosphatase [Maribacter thermophilus]